LPLSKLSLKIPCELVPLGKAKDSPALNNFDPMKFSFLRTLIGNEL